MWQISSPGLSTGANLKNACAKIVKEVREAKKVILFIDEIHTHVGAGGPKGRRRREHNQAEPFKGENSR